MAEPDRQTDRAVGSRALTYRPAVKRSVTIAGHPTSIRLEPCFWAALDCEAVRRALPVNALIAQIDADRLSVADAPNLASAIRQWLYTLVNDGS